MNLCLVFCFWVSLLWSSFVLTAETRQGDALDRLMKAKKASIRTGLFESQLLALDPVLIRQDGSKERDKIGQLPGQPEKIDFQQYGGYVTVDEKAGRALFYYFAEAVGQQPSSKPLLLWLNGGPGCSSLGYGAMEELGPFRVMSDGKTLFRNPYAWNNAANVLFLESPAGVGYSYSNTTSDYNQSGDSRTAMDAYVFLVNWLERFPEYKTRDFYISGESYAGHYVPQLAHTILHQNELGRNTIINLKGITIGNAAINDETDEWGMFDYFWTHALVSDEVINEVHAYCDFSPNASVSDRCSDAIGNVSASVRPLDIYNIYGPLCPSSRLTSVPKEASVTAFDPCSDYYVNSYLNLPQVQQAFHANVTKLSHPWSACSKVIEVWNDSPSSTLEYLRESMEHGIRVWVYSGDTDGRVPITSTRYSLNTLKLGVKIPWQPWLHHGDVVIVTEVGGYSVVYSGDLTLATVRGAGHEVPSYQAERSLVYLKAFLQGHRLPTV